MIFRRKSTKAVSVTTPEVASYALVYHGKNRGTFGNQIVKIIEESSFCSTSPLVKRLIVKNVKVWCIVIQTSGSKSVRIICASVPYMLSLIAKTSPRMKSLLENESIASHVKFFQETDFESLLESLCSATIILHEGVKKCYPIVSFYLGHEALVFTKSSLFFLKDLLLQCLVSAFHFLCDDLPNILQSLCAQNYAIAKYFVRNLPVIAVGGARYSLLFILHIQRWVEASLKTAKKFVHFLRRSLLNVCFQVDYVQLVKIMYGYFMSVVTFMASLHTFKTLQSALIGCYPILLKHTRNFIEKGLPIVKAFISQFLPKIFKFVNNPEAIRVLYKQCLKLCEMMKPHFDNLFRVTSENVLKLFCFLMPWIVCVASETIHILKRLIFSDTTKRIFHEVFLCLKRLGPIACELYLKVYRAMVNFCKCVLSFPCKAIFHEMNVLLRPVVNEINSTSYVCAEEVLSKSYLAAQTVAPSLWCGLKVVAPLTIRASHELYATAKSSTAILYPELLKAVVVVSPELRKGLGVVLDDGRYACAEVATVSYHASQEFLFAVKCASSQLPFVFRALTEVTVTSSGAVTEIFLTSSKARIRVQNDLATAIQEVSSAIDSAQLELLDSVPADMLILLSKTNNSVFTYACQQYLLVVQDFSVLSCNAVQYSSTQIMRVLQRIANRNSSTSSRKNLATMRDTLTNLLVDFLLLSSDRAIHYSKQMSLAVFKKMSVTIPVLWQQSKAANAIIWRQFCRSSSALWTLLEQEAVSAFQFTCLYSPELWDFLKKSSYQTFQFTLDVSPGLWDAAKPLFPVMWSSNRNTIQYVWEFHLNTCSNTWKVIMPATSSSWEYLLKSCPKAWVAFCSNSKSQWVSFCNVVEFSWNAMTLSSAMSWKIFQKTVSTSWRNVLKPVTTSACCGASSTVAKSLRLTNSVCTKSKEFLLIYKTSLHDFNLE